MKVRLAIFNHVSSSGKVYVANSKEEIENLFNKPEFYLTGFGGNEAPAKTTKEKFEQSIFTEEKLKQAATVNIPDIIGKFNNFEVVKTGDIGIGDLPIYEVYGEINIFDNPGGKVFEENYKENTMTFGMRSFGKQNVTNNSFNIEKLICWDAITK